MAFSGKIAQTHGMVSLTFAIKKQKAYPLQKHKKTS